MAYSNIALPAHTDTAYFVCSALSLCSIPPLTSLSHRPIPAASSFSTCSSTQAAQAASPSSSTVSTSPPSSAISTQTHTASFPQSQFPTMPQANLGTCTVPRTHPSSTSTSTTAAAPAVVRPETELETDADADETCVRCGGTTTTGACFVACRMRTSRVCTKRCVCGTDSSRPRTRSFGCSSRQEASSVCCVLLPSPSFFLLHFLDDMMREIGTS